MENIKNYKKVIRQLLSIGEMEVDQLIKISEYQPDIIQAARERADEVGVLVDWGIIIKTLVDLTKESIDYIQMRNELCDAFPMLSSNEIVAECEELEEYINSITIDDNGCSWGEIASANDSKYEDVGDNFKDLLNGCISINEFYEEVIRTMSKIINDENKEKELKPIGVYSVSNALAVYIYKIDTDEDIVLAGTSLDDVEECPLEGDTFKFGEIEIALSECMRL